MWPKGWNSFSPYLPIVPALLQKQNTFSHKGEVHLYENLPLPYCSSEESSLSRHRFYKRTKPWCLIHLLHIMNGLLSKASRKVLVLSLAKIKKMTSHFLCFVTHWKNSGWERFYFVPLIYWSTPVLGPHWDIMMVLE